MVIMNKNYTDEEFEKEYKEILKYYKSLSKPSDNPKVFLLGGQPGAGKTGLENMINKDSEYISISGDDFREYHPLFEELNEKYGKDSSKHTQQWAGEMTEKIIKELKDNKYNLIIEGTLRTAELPLKEATRFKEVGYEVELCVVAVKLEKSRLGTLERYERMLKRGKTPRMTPKEHHDLVVNNIPDNLDVLYKSGKFDNIRLFNRDSDCLYNLKETPDISPKEIINQEFNREWKSNEIEEYRERWNNLIDGMQKRGEDRDEIKALKFERNSIIDRITNSKNDKTIDKEHSNIFNTVQKNKDKDLER